LAAGRSSTLIISAPYIVTATWPSIDRFLK
jgi:hypothetical protein